MRKGQKIILEKAAKLIINKKRSFFIAQVQTIKNAPVDKREIEEYINSLL